MSKARSPRDVCSTTMGINGLICSSAPSASWGPKFRGLGRLLLLRRPDGFARLVQLGRDRLHLGDDAVERALEPNVVAHVVGAAACDELLDVLVVLARGAQLLPDLVVGDLDSELVRDRLEHELTRDGE